MMTTLLVLVALGAVAYYFRDKIKALFPKEVEKIKVEIDKTLGDK